MDGGQRQRESQLSKSFIDHVVRRRPGVTPTRTKKHTRACERLRARLGDKFISLEWSDGALNGPGWLASFYDDTERKRDADGYYHYELPPQGFLEEWHAAISGEFQPLTFRFVPR
jgi:hypothetical protein